MNTDQRVRDFTASLPQVAAADACYRAVETFCSDVSATTPELMLTPHTRASDLLSLCAAGAVHLYQAQAVLPARTGRAVFALLLGRVFGWSQREAWSRAEALWAEELEPTSDLARSMELGRDVFHEWQEAPGTPRAARLGAFLRTAEQPPAGSSEACSSSRASSSWLMATFAWALW